MEKRDLSADDHTIVREVVKESVQVLTSVVWGSLRNAWIVCFRLRGNYL
jgi:hypothetical protein